MVLINFYKIISSNTPKVYIGSTVKTIEERLRGHEYDYNKFQNEKGNYTTSFDILDFKNYNIELIETLECETKEDRKTIERSHILNNPTAVNKIQPGRTHQQYRQDHIEDIQQYRQESKQYFQQYYQNNKQNLQQKHDCPCSGKYSTAGIAKHKKTKKHQNYIRNQQPM